MEKFCAITPTRGDRPDFLDHLKWQVSRMTLKPDDWFIVDYPPVSDDFDLCERVHYGCMLAKEKGYDLVFILEDDDAYPDDYFERFGDMKADFFGEANTVYYNIRQRGYRMFNHPGRSSLFTTGFRLSKLEGFQFGGDIFLDIRLWRWAKEKGLDCRFSDDLGALGIKHNTGLCAGKGHIQKVAHHDPKFSWLKNYVDETSFDFYVNMSYKISE